MLSFSRLTDPAKGSACKHRACCNYDVLRGYVGRVSRGPKQCPLAMCSARLQRTRDVERDPALQALVEQVPRDTATVWLRGYEIRTSRPAACGGSASRCATGEAAQGCGAL